MHSPDILDDPNIRHYLPPSKPQAHINFYQATPAGTVLVSRTVEIVPFPSEEAKELARESAPCHDLLSKPIAQILADLAAQKAEKTKLEETAAAEKKDSEPMRDVPAHRDSEGDEDSALWVDKYEPRVFTDLLTEERTNREALMWMKSWDKIVFPHRAKPTPPPAPLPMVVASSNSKHQAPLVLCNILIRFPIVRGQRSSWHNVLLPVP